MSVSGGGSEDHSCRFNKPYARTHQTKKYGYDFQKFLDQDLMAAELYTAMLEEILELGVSIDQNKESSIPQGDGPAYRAPIGERALWKAKRAWPYVPWCGELIIEGSDDGKGNIEVDWRSYFFDLRAAGEPDIEIDDVLLASIEGKRRRVRKVLRFPAQLSEQDTHILKAMDQAFNWCMKVRREFTLRAINHAQ